jgi:hypothetical protein
MYSIDDFGSKTLKIVLIHLLEVIVIDLALNVLIVFNSCVFLKILLYSSV